MKGSIRPKAMVLIGITLFTGCGGSVSTNVEKEGRTDAGRNSVHSDPDPRNVASSDAGNGADASSVSLPGRKITAPPQGIYLGAYDWAQKGQKNGVKEFETAVGKKVAIVGQLSYIRDHSGSEGPLPSIDIAGHERAYQEGYTTFFGIEYQINSDKVRPQAIIEGALDNEITTIAQELKKWGRPIFWLYQREPIIQPKLGFGGGGYGPEGRDLGNENQDNYGRYRSPFGTSCDTKGDPMCEDGPERYRDAARHIHDLVENITPDQVTWVMGADVSWNAGQYTQFYPGDTYVDWHAFDRYVGQESNANPMAYRSFSQDKLWKEALELARKPIMLVEFGVFNTVDNGNPIDRTSWFQSFFNDLRTNPEMSDCKAFIYWQMGPDLNFTTRIAASDPEAKIWQAEIAAHSSFWISSVGLGSF